MPILVIFRSKSRLKMLISNWKLCLLLKYVLKSHFKFSIIDEIDSFNFLALLINNLIFEKLDNFPLINKFKDCIFCQVRKLRAALNKLNFILNLSQFELLYSLIVILPRKDAYYTVFLAFINIYFSLFVNFNLFPERLTFLQNVNFIFLVEKSEYFDKFKIFIIWSWVFDRICDSIYLVQIWNCRLIHFQVLIFKLI